MEEVQEPVEEKGKTIDVASILPTPTYMPSISGEMDEESDKALEEVDETLRNTRLNALMYDKTEEEIEQELESHSEHSSKVVSPVRSASPSVFSQSGQLISPSLKPVGAGRKATHIRPDKFEKRIMFETLSTDSSDLVLTLKTRHKDFKFSRISRTWLCGYDENECSLVALKWAVDEMMDDGDTIVCLRVLDKEPAEVRSQAEKLKRESVSIMDEIISQNVDSKAISIVFELSVGKVPKMIEKAISDYDPSILIVGTRGIQKTKFKDAFITPKSMSKYCLQFSNIPVIVVNPFYVPRSNNNSCTNLADQEVDLHNFYKERLTSYIPTPSGTPGGTPVMRPHLQHMDSTGSISHISLDTLHEPRSRLSKFRRALSPSPSPRSQSPQDRALSPVRSRGMSPGGSFLSKLKKSHQ